MMVASLVAGGTTVLLTTQYLEEADRLAERLVVIDHGKVIAEGTPASLKAELGATVLDLGLANEDEARRAGNLLAEVGGKAPVLDGTTVELNVDDGPRVVGRRVEDPGAAGHHAGNARPPRAEPRRRLSRPHRAAHRRRRG